MSSQDVEGFAPGSPLWRQLTTALGERKMGHATGAGVVEWAETALMAGLDSPTLRVLAGLARPPNEFEIDRYLSLVAAEFGVVLPASEEILAQYAEQVAEDIVRGSVAPRVGAKHLYEISQATGSLSDLSVWSGLDDALGMAENGTYGTVEEVEAEITAQARRMLERPESD